MTLVQVANIAGYSDSYFSQVETGQRRVNDDILAGYSKALGISKGALLERAPMEDERVLDLSDPKLIATIWEGVPEEQRGPAFKALLAFVERT